MEHPFEVWHGEQEFWKPNSRRDELRPVYEKLKSKGVPEDEIFEVFETLISSIADEHGC